MRPRSCSSYILHHVNRNSATPKYLVNLNYDGEMVMETKISPSCVASIFEGNILGQNFHGKNSTWKFVGKIVDCEKLTNGRVSATAFKMFEVVPVS